MDSFGSVGLSTLRIAYLTSQYARASDTFLRDEVAEVRALGHDVFTFSVRAAPLGELVDENVARERANTEVILQVSPFSLVMAALVCAWRRPGRWWRALRESFSLGWPGWKGRLWPLFYLVEAAYLACRLEAHAVEHLHVHIAEGPGAVGMLASILSGVPYSLTIHGPSEFDIPLTLALDRKVGRAAFTVAVCEFGRSQLYRWTNPEDWDRIHIVHCGVGATFSNGPGEPVPTVSRLVFVGRLAEQKGPLVLIEAAALLARDGLEFELNLIGDGPLRSLMEGRIARHGLTDRVRISGWMTSDSIRRELLASRALVLPSFAEGLPVVLMEALALGRPAISTYVAGIPELVEPGSSGWLVPAGAVGPLAEAMRTALTLAPEDLDRMGQAGAHAVAERHDVRKEARRLVDLFEQARSRADVAR